MGSPGSGTVAERSPTPDPDYPGSQLAHGVYNAHDLQQGLERITTIFDQSVTSPDFLLEDSFAVTQRRRRDAELYPGLAKIFTLRLRAQDVLAHPDNTGSLRPVARFGRIWHDYILRGSRIEYETVLPFTNPGPLFRIEQCRPPHVRPQRPLYVILGREALGRLKVFGSDYKEACADNPRVITDERLRQMPLSDLRPIATTSQRQ